MMTEVKIAPTYTKDGFKIPTNMPGCYRECEESNCERLVPCPYVRCQEHRTDFAINDSTVESLDPKDVIIIS